MFSTAIGGIKINKHQTAPKGLVQITDREINEHELFPALPASQPSQQMYLSRQDENYLVANGVNPRAILPSGTFKNCSFSFSINVNKA